MKLLQTDLFKFTEKHKCSTPNICSPCIQLMFLHSQVFKVKRNLVCRIKHKCIVTIHLYQFLYNETGSKRKALNIYWVNYIFKSVAFFAVIILMKLIICVLLPEHKCFHQCIFSSRYNLINTLPNMSGVLLNWRKHLVRGGSCDSKPLLLDKLD